MTSGVQTATSAVPMRAPRGRIRADLVYLGWQYLVKQPDPGPMPEPPGHVVLAEVSAEWLAAQRREQDLLSRPARTWTAVSAAAVVGVAWCWLSGLLPIGPALVVALALAATGAAGLRAVMRGERALRAQIRAETDRVRQIRTVQESEVVARQVEHVRSHHGWQRRSTAFRRQPLWYPVTLPVGAAGRLDVAGGTLAGWSALFTMIAATRLAAGGEVTVLDLTEGGVAGDVIGLASAWGIRPHVWGLPGDLPELDLGLRLVPESLAEVLALTAAASGEPGGTSDQARDAALLVLVLQVLGPGASLGQLMAALRALARIGAPREILAAGELSAAQLTGLTAMFGRTTEQLVMDRAWALEARLRVLSPLGTGLASHPRSQLRVAWLDRGAPVTGNRVLASYLAIAVTEVLRQAPTGRPWQQTVCLLGAERLPADVLDRVCAAAEAARAGLVLGYQSIPQQVRARLGRGNAVVGFMRLGNAEDARTAAEQIGTQHRFVVSQLTDTVGSSLTDTSGDSYTPTIGIADSVADSGSATWTAGRSRGHGRSGHGSLVPFAAVSGSASRDASTSAAISDSRSVTAGITASTSWGWNTSRAIGANSSLAGTMQRSRELLVEPHELQHLPQTAIFVCQHGPGGREVILADANPAIMTLPTATLAVRADGWRR